MTDPVSWLQIEQGWQVVTSDGTTLGEVGQVTGDKNSDIFDGLAVVSERSKRILYVPGEQVGTIVPGAVTLRITAAQAETLEPFAEAPPQTTIRPGQPSLGARVSNWLRGRR